MFRKQNIIILNIVLLAVLSLSCYSTIRGFVPKQEIKRVNGKAASKSEIEQAVERLPRVEYDIVAKNNIFDAKLKLPPKPKVIPPPEQLKWKLKGVSYMGGRKLAYIEMVTTVTKRDRRRKKRTSTSATVVTVEEGKHILEHDVEILEINIREEYVKYVCTHNGKLLDPEYLYKEESKVSIFNKSTEKDYSFIIVLRPGRREEYNVSRAALKKQIKDVAEVMGQVRLIPQTDPKAGNRVAGLEIKKTDDVYLLNAFGLQEKDILLKVDGQAVDGVDKLVEILGALAGKDMIEITVLRVKKSMNIKYHMVR